MKRFWELYRELLGDAALIVTGGYLLFRFVQNVFRFYIYEPNLPVAIAETIASALMVVLGIDRLCKDWRK